MVVEQVLRRCGRSGNTVRPCHEDNGSSPTSPTSSAEEHDINRYQCAQTAGSRCEGTFWTVKIGSDNRTREIAPSAESLILQRLIAEDIKLVSWQTGEGCWQGRSEEMITSQVTSFGGFVPLFRALHSLLHTLQQVAIGVYQPGGQYIRLMEDTCLIPAGAVLIRREDRRVSAHAGTPPRARLRVVDRRFLGSLWECPAAACLNPDDDGSLKAWLRAGHLRAHLPLSHGNHLVWGCPAKDDTLEPLTIVKHETGF